MVFSRFKPRPHRNVARRQHLLSTEMLESRQLLAADLVSLNPDRFTVQQESDWVTFDVLANDIFAPEYTGAGKITAASDGSLGGWVRLADEGGALQYLPASGIWGEEKIAYIVDGEYFTDVTVTIVPPIEKDEFHLIQATGEKQLFVMANDLFFPDYEGERMISDVSATNSGATVRVAADGKSVFYAAADDFYGHDTFRYLVDGRFETSVSVQVHRPVRDDHGIEIERNSSENILYPLNNDYLSSIEGWFPAEQRIVTEITSVSDTEQGGVVTISNDGRSLRYTPPVDYVGYDSFYYLADDVYQARVTLNVTRPVRDDRVEVWQLSEGNRLHVRSNDFLSDAYPGARIITDVTAATNGVVAITNDGLDLVYTPNPDYFGYDQFAYTIDADLTATVRVNVEPLAQSDSYRFGVDPAISQYTLAVLANDYYVHYDGPRVITAVTQPENGGSVTVLADGRLRFVPADERTGRAYFSYTVDDRFTATVSVYISGYLSGDSLVVKQNSTANVLDLLKNDDFDRDDRWWSLGPYRGPRIITGVSETEAGGIVEVGGDGKSVRYTPPANYVGVDSFRYTVDDVQSAGVYLSVISFARADRFRVEPDSAGETLSVLVNDRADRGTTKAVDRVDAALNGGIATVVNDGTAVQYIPAEGFIGTDSFHYYLTDGSRGEVTVEVSQDVSDLLPRFDDHADMGQFLIDDALERYDGLFGQPWYPYRGFITGDDFANFDASPEQDRSHSETNVQVAGVDEGDVIEVDSDHLYVVTQDSLLIVDAWPAEAMNVASRTLLEGQPLVEYLRDDRLTVISDTSVYIPPDDVPIDFFGDVSIDGPFFPPYFGSYESSVTVTVFDLTDRTAPTVVEKTKFDGAYKDSRAINGFVYLVLQEEFVLPEPEVICDEDDPNDEFDEPACHYETREVYLERVQQNIGVLIDESLPHFSSYGADGGFVRGGLLTEADEVFRPAFDERGDLLVVTAIDMKTDEVGPVASAAIPMSTASQIYGSLDNLYVFGQDSYSDYDPATSVLKFAWNGDTGGLDFVASGRLPGSLNGGNAYGGIYYDDVYIPPSGTGNGQFSIDEHEGLLRIATTTRSVDTGEWNWRTASDLYVLSDDDGVLESVGGLQDMSPDETIESVRFLGDRAFIVTFRTVDPLLAIDLQNPLEPVLEGRLMIPGFSSYLQPISDDLVIGLGRNTPNGRDGPSQLSLFDISDLGNPRRLDEYTWDHWSKSEAALDHHAFGFFPEHSVVTIPVGSSRWVWTDTDDDGFRDQYVHHRTDDLYVFRYDASSATIEELGNVSHDFLVRRSGYIADRLYSVSTDDVIVSDINNPSTPIANVEFGARMVEPEPVPPEVALAARSTPSPLDDDRVREIAAAARTHLGNELGISAGQVSVIAVEGEVFTTFCQPADLGGNFCATALTAGYEMVLDAAGSRYLYTATTASDITMREMNFDFLAAPAAAHNGQLPADANDDGVVSPLDALLVINELGFAEGIAPLRSVERNYIEGRLLADVNNDGSVSPLDALLIINDLGSSTNAVPQAAPLAAVMHDVAVSDDVVDSLTSILSHSGGSVVTITEANFAERTALARWSRPKLYPSESLGSVSTDAPATQESLHDLALIDWA